MGRTDVRVRVPGSTSNLGSGFDALGLALSMHLEVRARARPGTDPLDWGARTGTAREWPTGEGELVARAFRRSAGDAAEGWRLSAHSEIPTGRGFGSSGAAIVAGLLLGEAVARGTGALPDAEREELLRAALEMEGHPDNVAPSLLGGCTLAVPTPDGLLVARPHLDPGLAFAVAWPDAPLETARARAALPAEVPHADAVENARRFGLLLEGLRAGVDAWIRAGVEDALHVPYRLPLVPGAREALAAARDAGAIAATLSGSGSGLFAIARQDRVARVAEAMAAALREATGSGTGRVVERVTDAPRVQT